MTTASLLLSVVGVLPVAAAVWPRGDVGQADRVVVAQRRPLLASVAPVELTRSGAEA
ncbi:hypothetical protein ACWEJ6_54305 [Nonomuraea sp. NPDC004702]